MIINTDYPYSYHVIPFINGVESTRCRQIDTKTGVAIVLGDIDLKKGLIAENKIYGIVEFKLVRGKNIPDPYFTELTTDIGFIGFTD